MIMNVDQYNEYINSNSMLHKIFNYSITVYLALAGDKSGACSTFFQILHAVTEPRFI